MENTAVQTIPAKSIVFRVKKPAYWFGAEYNMNIYRGCSHGCIYCDSRSNCYRNPNFDTIKVKQDALRLLRDDLRRKVKSGLIATGAMSDPYNPLESRLKLTRNALELINAYEFGVAIATKSALVARDTDILQDITRHSPVIVKITITAADDGLCRMLEPNVSATSERFAAMQTLAKAGIYCGVLLMPVLPFITDTRENILSIVRQTKEAGGSFVYPALGMTLRAGNREYYYDNIDKLFPGLKQKYIQRYGERYQCGSPQAKSLWTAFKHECEQNSLSYDMLAITRHYKTGYAPKQLTLW